MSFSYLPKRNPAYTDNDQIWFGKFKGEKLMDVPASYLKWWFDENHDQYKNLLTPVDTTNRNLLLYNYINNVMNAILQDLKS